MDLNKLGQITEIRVLYDEYLSQFNTEWLQIQRVTTAGKGAPQPRLTARQSMMRVWRHNMVFHFSLHIATEPNEVYTYEFYPESAGPELQSTVNRAAPVRLPSDNRLLSALYVYRAAQQLSLYTEPIDAHALRHLDGVMNDDGGATSREHLTPELFYRHLVNIVDQVGGASDLLSVVAPGRHANNFRPNITCTLRPVYGPAHQPLHVTLDNGLYYRIFFGAEPVDEAEGGSGERNDAVITLPVGSESGANVTYDIMAVVEALATLLVGGGGGAEKALKELVVNYRPDDNRLGRLYSQRVSAVMEPGVLYAIKLAQLVLDDTSSDTQQAFKAKELHTAVKRAYTGAGVTDTDDVFLARTLYRLIGDVTRVSHLNK